LSMLARNFVCATFFCIFFLSIDCPKACVVHKACYHFQALCVLFFLQLLSLHLHITQGNHDQVL
jgi:hypothetical protein